MRDKKEESNVRVRVSGTSVANMKVVIRHNECEALIGKYFISIVTLF